MKEFQTQCDIVKDNPGGMDKLANPHNFSSNPGWMSTGSMLQASRPANGDGVIRGMSARGSLPRPIRTGPSHPISAASSR